MKKPLKKLVLSKETLVTLLTQVSGGVTGVTTIASRCGVCTSGPQIC